MPRLIDRIFLTVAVMGCIAATASAQNQPFQEIAKKIEARVGPTVVKRGATANWTLTVEIADGWHTYPTRQADPRSSSYVNRLKFSEQSGIVFVGELKEPAGNDKEENGTKITMIEGIGTWERTIVVRPDAKPGKYKVQVPFTILACNDSGCLPPKKVTTEFELTISDEPAVAVDPKYQKELQTPAK